MAIASYNFVFQQGDDAEINLVYKVGTTPTPVNLTGYKLRMDVRTLDGQILYTFNSDDVTGGGALDVPGAADNEAVLGSDGSINITIPRAASLDAGNFANHVDEALLFDVFLRNTNNKQTKIFKGTMTFESSETRWT